MGCWQSVTAISHDVFRGAVAGDLTRAWMSGLCKARDTHLRRPCLLVRLVPYMQQARWPGVPNLRFAQENRGRPSPVLVTIVAYTSFGRMFYIPSGTAIGSLTNLLSECVISPGPEACPEQHNEAWYTTSQGFFVQIECSSGRCHIMYIADFTGSGLAAALSRSE